MPSSVVAGMEYNQDQHKLRITYVSGNVYDYKEVPERVYQQMRAASSKGTFLNRRIKGHFDFEQVV